MLALSRTTAPPDGAGLVSVTVPLVTVSPVILELARDNAAKLAAGVGLPAGSKFNQAEGAL
jgi:hypothetical protein